MSSIALLTIELDAKNPYKSVELALLSSDDSAGEISNAVKTSTTAEANIDHNLLVIHRLTHIHFAAFVANNDAVITNGFGQSKTARTWFINLLSEEIKETKATFLVVVDTSSWIASLPYTPEDVVKRIIAFGKWNPPEPGASPVGPEDVLRELPPLPDEADSDPEFLTTLIALWVTKRNEVMSSELDTKCGYWYLEMLATLPECQGRGAAGKIIRYGLDRADADGLRSYLEATPNSVDLYKHYCYVPLDVAVAKMKRGGFYTNTCMVREHRPLALRKS